MHKGSFKASQYNFKTLSTDRRYILLFNTLSGEILRIPIELSYQLNDCLENVSRQSFSNNRRLCSLLQKGGFLINDNCDEKRILQKKYRHIKKRNVLHLSIMPTLDCNFRCSYCFEQRKKLSMSENEAESIIKFLQKRGSNFSEIQIDWYGGEPSIRHKFILSLQKRIRSLISSFKSHGIYSMTSNGYLLKPDVSKQLIDSGISSYQISIDGPKKIHDCRRKLSNGAGTFDTIVNNLTFLIDKSSVNLRVNIDKTNILSIKELIDFLVYNNLISVNSLTFKAVVFAGGIDKEKLSYSPSEFSQVISEAEEYALLKGFNLYCEPRDVCEFCPVDLPNQWIIGPDLSLYKCADAFNSSTDSVGYISEDGEIITNERLKMWLNKPVFSDAECSQCLYLPQCMGGCSLKKNVHKNNWCPPEKYNLETYVNRFYTQTNEIF